MARMDWTPLPDAEFELVKKSLDGVIPAKAGIQKARATLQRPHWIPAFAGMTQQFPGMTRGI